MQIEVTRMVPAEPADAFAVVANVLEWPLIVRSVKSIELLTTGPVRTGTRLRERRTMLRRDLIHEAELRIDEPRRLCLVSEPPDARYELDHLVEAVLGGGCRLMLIFRSRARGGIGRTILPLEAPFIGVTLRDELEQDLSDFATAIAARHGGDRINEKTPAD